MNFNFLSLKWFLHPEGPSCKILLACLRHCLRKIHFYDSFLLLSKLSVKFRSWTASISCHWRFQCHVIKDHLTISKSIDTRPISTTHKWSKMSSKLLQVYFCKNISNWLHVYSGQQTGLAVKGLQVPPEGRHLYYFFCSFSTTYFSFLKKFWTKKWIFGTVWHTFLNI